MKVTVVQTRVPEEEKCLKEKLDETTEISPVEIVNVERKEVPQEEKSVKENADQEAKIYQEEKVIIVVEEPEKQEDVKAERLENGTEVEVEVEVANQQAVGERKLEEIHTDSPKKSKPVSKQSSKMKVTVPKPFSLETEKRKSRERRGSMDFNDSKPNLSKSLSLNYKSMSQSYLGPERSSDLRENGRTTKTGLKIKVVPDERNDKIVTNGSSRKEKRSIKETEKKKPQVSVKKNEGNELSNNKLQKKTTFKALPLPTFYHQKDSPPKPQTKKIRVKQSKPPLTNELTKTGSRKTDDKKIEEKEKKVSGRISSSSSTKETISKLFKATRNSISNPKEKVKAVVSGS